MASEMMKQGFLRWSYLVRQIATSQYRRGGGKDNSRCPYDDLYAAGALGLLNLFERTGTTEHAWIYVHNTILGAVVNFVQDQHVAGPKRPKNRKKLVVYFHGADEEDAPADHDAQEGFTIDHVRHQAPKDAMMALSLEWALCQLKPHEEKVMRLYFLADLEVTEVARELGISHQAVCKAMKNAIARLRQILYPEGYTEAKSNRIAPKRRGPKARLEA